MSGKGFDTRKLMTGKDGMLFITLVRDDLTIVPMLEAIKNGKIPTFSLQGGVTEPLAGGESKYLLDECIPDGDTNILEVKPGEIIKRQCQFIVNSVPDCIKSLAV